MTLAHSILAVGLIAVLALWDLGRRTFVSKDVLGQVRELEGRLVQTHAQYNLALVEHKDATWKHVGELRNELRAHPARGVPLPFGKR